MTAERLDIIKTITNICKPSVDFALLFGSVLKPSFNNESDIDLAVYLQKNAGTNAKDILRTELSKNLDRDYDIIFLNDSDIIITLQVLGNGQLIVNNNELEFFSFKARKISEYIDFKMSRKLVEENLVKGLKNA